jgi:hypothetical protein
MGNSIDTLFNGVVDVMTVGPCEICGISGHSETSIVDPGNPGLLRLCTEHKRQLKCGEISRGFVYWLRDNKD